MPDVQRAGAVEDRLEPDAGGAEPEPQVVVFLAPADEPLVETVDTNEVVPPDAEVAAGEAGLGGMPDGGVPPCLETAAGKASPLGFGYESGKIGCGQVLRHEQAARRLGEQPAVAQQRGAESAPGDVGRHVVSRHHAVAVEKHEVAAAGDPRRLIADPGQAEAVVRLARKPHGKRGRRGEAAHEIGRLVVRPIVRHDHLQRGVSALLQRE